MHWSALKIEGIIQSSDKDKSRLKNNIQVFIVFLIFYLLY